MPRLFFHNHDFLENENILLDKDESIHLRDVMKKKSGDEIYLTNGRGLKAHAVIQALSPSVELKILKVDQFKNTEWNLNIFQGALSSTKMDLLIQKLTELGVSSFSPLITEKSLIDFKNEKKIESKLNRWSKISLEALKQSGRANALRINHPAKLSTILEKLSGQGAPICYLNEYGGEKINTFLKSFPENTKDYNVFVGPESGWSTSEITVLENSGAIPISLGEAILRAETASIAIASFLMIQNTCR